MDSGHLDSLRRLKISLLDLEMAFDNSSYEMSYYLDRETGDVVMVTSEAARAVEQDEEEDLDSLGASFALDIPAGMGDMVEDARRILKDEAGRYIEVPRQDSREGYGDMQDFVGTVVNESLRERLWDAIQGRGSFRRFKDILTRYPEERQRWFEYEQECALQRIVAWLAEEGIEPLADDVSQGAEDSDVSR